MALETQLSILETCLLELRRALTELRVTIIEDSPLEDPVALVDLLSDAAEDLLSHVEEAAARAGAARRAEVHPADLREVWTLLADCHEALQGGTAAAFAGLLSMRRRGQLAALGAARGHAWRAWAELVGGRLEHLQSLLLRLHEAALACWRELGERLVERGARRMFGEAV